MANSGLGLTHSSTPAQIYAALATKFPPTKSMIVPGWTLSGNNPATSLISNTSYVKMTMGNHQTRGVTSNMISPVFDITSFKSLALLGESYKITGNTSSNGYTPKIYLVNNSTGGRTLVYEHPNYGTKKTTNQIAVTHNTASLTGNYYLLGEIYSYEGVDSNGNSSNGSTNVGAYIYLTKALLSA